MRTILLIATVAVLAQAQNSMPPYPAPGTMVDAGGYRVHLDCKGAGNPTVMIVGGFSFDWSLVQPEVARLTRVCTYDASGTAWSEAFPDGSGRECPAWVNEVRKVLRRGQREGQYVLVGLSAGAVVARLYAMSFPEEVAGIVLVDHAFLFPDQKVQQKDNASATTHAVKGPDGVDSPPAVLSTTPVIVSPEDEPGFDRLPREARELDRWARSMNADLPTEQTTRRCVAAAEAASNGRPYPLGRIPLVVIRTENDAAGYAELQRHLLSLSRNSREMVANGSFHSIEISRPDVAIEGIREVIHAVRGHAPLSSTK
jgi:pimeloyl-ACP methyl ester carboxylesterase